VQEATRTPGSTLAERAPPGFGTMGAMLPRAVAVVLVMGSLVQASPAAAYERSTVDDEPGGTPLSWSVRRVEVRLASSSIPGVSPEDGRVAFQASLRAWSLAGGCTDFVLVDGGEVRGLSTSLGGGAPDSENRVVFRATDWPPELGPETLALTSAVYRRSTGQIVDADIDVNAVDHVWSTSIPALAGHDDVQNTLTHELGHLLGFGHSDVADATMVASAAPEETGKRDLAEDDIIAVCDVYPGATRRGPRSSCAASGARGGRVGAGLAGLGVAGLGLACLTTLALRRRRARRAPSGS